MTTKPKGLKVWVNHFMVIYKTYPTKQNAKDEVWANHNYIDDDGLKLFGPMKDGEIKRFEITAKEVKRK